MNDVLSTPRIEPGKLFLDSVSPFNSSRLSFLLRDEAELARVVRRRRVLALGRPESLGPGGESILAALERNAVSVERVGSINRSAVSVGRKATSVAQTDRIGLEDPACSGLLTAWASRKDALPGLIFLAEAAYGPAFERLCERINFSLPVLFPSGYLSPALPGCGLNYAQPEGTAIRDLRRALAAFAGKGAMIWNCGGFFQDLILPILREYGPQLDIRGVIDPDRQNWGRELAGYPVYPPARLGASAYDLLVFSSETSPALYPAMHFYTRDFTPLLALHPYGGAGGHTSSAGLAHSLLSGRSFERESPGMALTKDIYDILYARHPDFSDSHYNELKRTSVPPILRNLAYQPADLETEFVKVRQGVRFTPGVPAFATRAVHVFGPCFAYGSFCNDADTIPARLQALCNDDQDAKPPVVEVINRGLNAGLPDNTLRAMSATQMRPGDVAIHLLAYNHLDESAALAAWRLCRDRGVAFALFVVPSLVRGDPASTFEEELLAGYRARSGFISNAALRRHADEVTASRLAALHRHAGEATASGLAALSGGEVPVFDLQRVLPELRGEGEIFYDALHVSYKTYPKLARHIYESFVRPALRREADLPVSETSCTGGTLENHYENKILYSLLDEVRGLSLISASLMEWLRLVPRFEATQAAGAANPKASTGAVVMNCNPFTHGHRHMVSRALEFTDRLYIFVVEEDLSFFSFVDRLAMIRAGLADFGERVLVVPSGRHIISAASFPEYFSKDSITYEPDATGEILMFGTTIAPALGISVRFFGEEPYCAVTRAHHRQLARLLPLCGLQCREIPRLCAGGEPISASRVRQALAAGQWEELTGQLPQSTLDYLRFGAWERAVRRNSAK